MEASERTDHRLGRSEANLRPPRLPLVTNGGLVAIDTDRYHVRNFFMFFFFFFFFFISTAILLGIIIAVNERKYCKKHCCRNSSKCFSSQNLRMPGTWCQPSIIIEHERTFHSSQPILIELFQT